MITPKDLVNIGLAKIMEFLEIYTREEFIDFLVGMECPTIPLLAEFLSNIAVVCQN